ncbi:MAG: YraN family protein [Betaproteobacteria bacterium]|nr:YraN family protein [Betaproteobacteria bacterium]
MTRSPTQRLGDAGEDLALAYLERAGLSLVARQVAGRFGEIDLIMRERDELVFVEVRRRSRSDYGSAADSIGAAKQGRLRRSAELWLQKRHGDRLPACRFDVCAIDGERIDWIRNAF